MQKLPRFLVSFLVITLVGGIAIGVCVALLVPGARQIGVAHTYTASVGALRDLSSLTVVYDSAGNQLGELGAKEGTRRLVKLDEVPKIMQNAVIATEDQTFWTNPGFDIGGSVRALFENLGSGRIEQGGSTITQQLVKKRLLTDEQDVNRKIREMVLAYRLTEKYSKRQILEQYLNTVYFGQGSYGVKSAVERFFGKTDINTVTAGEAALLAAMIRSPSEDNPWDYPERARQRRSLVLDQMADQKYITDDEATFFKASPLVSGEKPSADLRPENSWVEQAQAVLSNDPRLGATRKAREKKLLEGGLKVYMTKDPALQTNAEAAVSDGLVGAASGFDGALVAMDPHTGFVKAMVDSRPFAESQFNLAIDGQGEQVGSSFKAVTLATLLANGYSPNDTVDGTSGCVVPPFLKEPPIANAEPGGGTMTLQQATTGSVNCAFVRAAASVGLDKVADMATKLGMRANVEGRQPFDQWAVPTITLGVISVTPVEMATIAATIANGGERHDPVYVWKVEDSQGRVIFDETNRPGERVLDADVAACEVRMLHGPLGPGGTASGLTPRGQDAFGKTGTNDNKASAAFLGATPDLAAFVWHGDAENPLDPPGGGKAGFGGDRPAHIWNAFMNASLSGTTGPAFPDPGARCAAPGKFIAPEGGRTTPVAPPPTQPLDPTATTYPGGILPPNTIPITVPNLPNLPNVPRVSIPQIPFPNQGNGD